MITRKETFGSIYVGQGSLTVKQLKANQFAVVRYLPPGMELEAHCYGRFETLEEANACFDAKRGQVAALFGEKPEPTFAQSLKLVMDAWEAGTPEVQAAILARMRETLGVANA